MLETLRVQNYALIDTIEVDFSHGFNVLTGETGAGKSIIVGALNLVLGARASSEDVRSGAKKATVDAVFRLENPSRRLETLLAEHELELEDGALMLSRVVTAEGRSKAYAGGTMVALKVLAAIGDELVDLHGQHEHQSLLKTDRQLELLDAFGGLADDRRQLADQVRALRELDRQLDALQSDDRERARQIEFLKFELNEIKEANLERGEEEELRARRAQITNAEAIVTAASNAYRLLYESDGGAALDNVDAAIRELEALAEVQETSAALAQQLNEARETVSAIADEIRGYTEEVEFDPGELDRINQRLSLIRDLKRKYGEDVDAILAYGETARAEIRTFDSRDEQIAELTAKRDEAQTDAGKRADDLSKKRHKAASKLNKAVTKALQDLGMGDARFEVAFERGELQTTGIDRVSFMLAANKGERLKPLKQVASGGEISRIMLALKATFADADDVPTLIFDEIDSGVGGAVANQVANKMAGLSESHQTICITHLPQIAAAATTHYHVSKRAVKDRSLTELKRIEDATRVEELARLLDGSVSDVSLEHARALLNAS